MMKPVTAVVFTLILTGCAASKVISFYVEDEDYIYFTTFSFYRRDVSALNSEQKKLDSLIEQTITEGLFAKGYSKSHPSDVYVSFQFTTSNTSTSQVNNPYSLGRSYYPYYKNYDFNVTQYKEGVLLIELHNQNDKLIWQGSKTFKVRNSKDIKQLLLQDAAEIIGAFKANS